ncbi:hemolysin family protein [Streptomyces sp. HB2AG]|uniref:hemolysin family protein n=1 Tax=Streptomyces sp. HB2AG TaxID=2983400 RepID=UPI0022AA2FB9|nr:hemolysin family protein [Streptomyces sp. HB2AG]MCZ2523105.1 hemolysin family protein [Streptomyces sp. HB2AG]
MVVAAVLLVVVGWLAACAEAGLARVSTFRAEAAVRAGRRGAEKLTAVAADPTRYLNVALLVRVACEMAAAALVTVVCVHTFEETWQILAVAIGVMVVVSYVALGVSPRTIGRQHPLNTATAAAYVLLPLARIMGPVPRLLILLGNALTPGKGFRQGPFASEAELRAMVDLAESESLIEDEERRMVHSVFELGDTLVREVMVPRTDLVVIERFKTIRQALTLALRSGFSRIPVTGENEDDIVGVVYLKDLARKVHINRDLENELVSTAMRPATFVPDTKNAGDLLREMQRDRNHVAVVVDEYGGTAGVVTIEDILEEIVGEITDEYDRELPPVEPLGDGTYRVTARLTVEDLGELYGLDLEDEDVETVGGLLAKALGKVPIEGATAVVEGLRLTAESVAGRRNRIGTVLVERAEADGREEQDERDGPDGRNGRDGQEPRDEKDAGAARDEDQSRRDGRAGAEGPRKPGAVPELRGTADR